jgi:hypothetical protein
MTIEELLTARQKIEITNIRLSSLPQKAVEIEEKGNTVEMMGHSAYHKVKGRIKQMEPGRVIT